MSRVAHALLGSVPFVVVSAVVTVVVSVVLTVPTAHADQASPADDVQAGRRTSVPTKDLLAPDGDDRAATSATLETVEPGSHLESIVGVSDVTGDASFPQADLIAVGADSDSSGVTTVAAMVATFETPFDASWQFRDTALLWGFDVDGDGDEDFAAMLVNFGGQLAAGVLDPADRLMCDAEPSWDASRRSYGVAFPTSCIGDPASYRFYVSFAYQDYTTAVASIDEAPDTTWSLPVDNDAAGSATPLFTACQPGTTAPSSTSSTSPDVAFQPIDPVRLLDTRSAMSTIDCLANGVGAVEGGDEVRLAVSGRGGIAAGARAVALNVTVIGAAGAGYLTVSPCGQPRPLASNVNFTAGATVANTVVVKLGTNGEVCLFSSARVDVVVDASGWFGTRSNLTATLPTRVLDTRSGHAPRRPAGSITEVVVGAPTGNSAPVTSVVLNVTVTDPDAAGFVTVFPCGTPMPLASNLNFAAGDTVANAVVAAVGVGPGVDSAVCLYTSAPAHLVADLGGWFTGRADFVPLAPARLLDTRPGMATIDGEGNGSGTPVGGAVTELVVAGRGGVPHEATAVVLNVTVTRTGGAGHLTVYPCGSTRPNASNVNFSANDTRANAVVAKIGAGGRVCLVSSVGADLVVDVGASHL